MPIGPTNRPTQTCQTSQRRVLPSLNRRNFFRGQISISKAIMAAPMMPSDRPMGSELIGQPTICSDASAYHTTAGAEQAKTRKPKYAKRCRTVGYPPRIKRHFQDYEDEEKYITSRNLLSTSRLGQTQKIRIALLDSTEKRRSSAESRSTIIDSTCRHG